MHDLHLPEHVGMAQVLAFRRHVGVDLLDRGGPGFPDGLQYVEFGAGGFGGEVTWRALRGSGKAGL